MSSIGTEPAPSNGDERPAPNMQIVAQFIKDLSFENPGAAANITQRPQIELGVDLNARKLDEVVEEILRPMLKTWLDSNLPQMVERMVREEIERVARGRR